MSKEIFDRPDSPQPTAPKVKKERKKKAIDPIEEEETLKMEIKEVENEVENEVKNDPPPKKEKKEKKPRKPMDEATKARLLEQLARGRETSKLNRKKRAEAKKIIRRKKDEDIDEIIKEDLERKKKENQDKNFLREELAELKNSLKELMAENKSLRTQKNNDRIEKVKEDIKEVKEDIQEVKQLKGDSIPKGSPMIPNVPIVRNLKVQTSRGIKSRWDKYKK